MLKRSGKQTARDGQSLHLLFLEPDKGAGAASFLEACIYQMDLEAGAKYYLFLAGRADMRGRFVMTAPPLLATRKATRRVKSALCTNCGRFLFLHPNV